MGEKEQVVDIKKIVEALELIDCEIIEIQRREDGPPYTDEYSLTVKPCYKKKD